MRRPCPLTRCTEVLTELHSPPPPPIPQAGRAEDPAVVKITQPGVAGSKVGLGGWEAGEGSRKAWEPGGQEEGRAGLRKLSLQ